MELPVVVVSGIVLGIDQFCLPLHGISLMSWSVELFGIDHDFAFQCLVQASCASLWHCLSIDHGFMSLHSRGGVSHGAGQWHCLGIDPSFACHYPVNVSLMWWSVALFGARPQLLTDCNKQYY